MSLRSLDYEANLAVTPVILLIARVYWSDPVGLVGVPVPRTTPCVSFQMLSAKSKGRTFPDMGGAILSQGRTFPDTTGRTNLQARAYK